MVLTRFLSHLWVQNRPIFKAFSALRGAKIAPHGLKMGSFHLCVHPQIVQRYLWKNPLFHPFLTDFLSQNSPFSRHFVTLQWPKWLAMGSKWAHVTFLGTPNGVGSFLGKRIFGPFLTHFLFEKQPIFKAFCDFGGAKMVCSGLISLV